LVHASWRSQPGSPGSGGASPYRAGVDAGSGGASPYRAGVNAGSDGASPFVVVTHELPQIYAIADNTIFLDAESKSLLGQGNPKDLAADPRTDPKVRQFLFRGNPDKAGIGQELLPDFAQQRTASKTTGHARNE
jgi:hypothetical protein